MAIYTKKGDKGKTRLVNTQGEPTVSKSSLIVESLGSIDELNSFLGVVASFTENTQLIDQVKQIQRNLLTIGSIVAGSDLKFPRKHTLELEKIIDKLEGTLPVLAHFIVLGGSKPAALLQYARSLARRTERRVVALSKEAKVRKEILVYLNRLSDALFMLARNENYLTNQTEEKWIGKKR